MLLVLPVRLQGLLRRREVRGDAGSQEVKFQWTLGGTLAFLTYLGLTQFGFQKGVTWNGMLDAEYAKLAASGIAGVLGAAWPYLKPLLGKLKLGNGEQLDRMEETLIRIDANTTPKT